MKPCSQMLYLPEMIVTVKQAYFISAVSDKRKVLYNWDQAASEHLDKNFASRHFQNGEKKQMFGFKKSFFTSVHFWNFFSATKKDPNFLQIFIFFDICGSSVASEIFDLTWNNDKPGDWLICGAQNSNFIKCQKINCWIYISVSNWDNSEK